MPGKPHEMSQTVTIDAAYTAKMTAPPPSAAELVTLGAHPSTRSGTTTWWFHDPGAEVSEWMSRRELVPHRRLHQMRVALPLAGVTPAVTRAFRPGLDDDGLLVVNNRAFDWHPDQGGWSIDDLRDRMSQSWFDPDGCRILDLDDTGRVDGFCWMKVHDDPPSGEIHVIALDPTLHGRGLGAPLAAAGLDWAARRDIHTGMLYVEEDNVPAVSLYLGMGFSIHHTDLGLIGPSPD